MITVDSTLNKEYMSQLLEIDRETFGLEPMPVEFQWAERFPEAYTLILKGDNVLGYGLALPVIRNALDALKQGRMSEEELTSRYLSESPDGFYLASIATSNSIRGRRSRAIIPGLLIGTTMGNPMKSGLEVIGIPVTSSGENICRMFQMRDISPERDLPFEGVNGFKPRVFSNFPLVA